MSCAHISGIWNTSAPPAGYLSGQSQCSFGFFWQLSSPSTPTGSAFLLGPTTTIFYNGGSGEWHFRQVGVNATLEATLANNLLLPDVPHLFLLTWDSAGIQQWSMDGVTFGLIVNGGHTATNSDILRIGYTSGGQPDYRFSDPFIFHGHVLTRSETAAIMGRTSTPQSLGATYWWPITGTPPNTIHPDTDAGWKDAVGGASQFSTPSTSGTVSAVYDAATLVAVSPYAVVDTHSGKTGKTIYVIPSGQTEAISILPTVTINNSPVTITELVTSDGFWAFTLPSQIQPTDTIHVSAPDDWIAGAFAFSRGATNNVGKCEFNINPPHTTKLGINLNQVPGTGGSGAIWTLAKNCAIRLSPNWTWSGTSTLPNRFFFNPSYGQQEFWFIVWDSDDLNTDFSITDDSNGPWTCTHRPDLDVLAPGGGVGIARAYEVTRNGAGNPGPTLGLVRHHPTQSPIYSNLALFWSDLAPDCNLNRSDPWAIDPRVIRRLKSPNGNAPAVIRGWIVDDGGQSNAVTSVDIGTPRVISASVGSLVPVDLTSTPTVQGFNGPITIPSINDFSPGWWIATATTTTPHGFGIGQLIATHSIPSGLTAGGVTIPPGNYTSLVYPIDSTHYIMSTAMGGLPNSVVNLDAPATFGTPLSVTCTVGSVPPVEYFCTLCNELGSDLWIQIPVCFSNQGMQDLTTRIAAVLDLSLNLVIEYCNETWNFQGPQFNAKANFCCVMGQLLGISGFDPEEFTAQRLSEVYAQAKTAWLAAGRSTSTLKMALMSQWTNMGRGRLTYAAANGIKAHITGGAPYWNSPFAATGDLAIDAELMRHWVILDPTNLSYQADAKNVRASYEAAIGQPVELWAYEAAIEIMPGNEWDWPHHPDAGITEETSWLADQQFGEFDRICHFNFSQRPSGDVWGIYMTQGQLPGPGISNMLNGSEVVTNQSVRGQAFLDWVQNGSPQPPSRGGARLLATM